MTPSLIYIVYIQVTYKGEGKKQLLMLFLQNVTQHNLGIAAEYSSAS